NIFLKLPNRIMQNHISQDHAHRVVLNCLLAQWRLTNRFASLLKASVSWQPLPREHLLDKLADEAKCFSKFRNQLSCCPVLPSIAKTCLAAYMYFFGQEKKCVFRFFLNAQAKRNIS